MPCPSTQRRLRRATIGCSVAWAAIPLLTAVYMQCRLLPGEGAGYGLFVPYAGLAWLLSGLVLLPPIAYCVRPKSPLWIVAPVTVVAALIAVRFLNPLFDPIKRVFWNRRAAQIVAANPHAAVIFVDGKYWYDDVGYLVRGSVASGDGHMVELDLDGLSWSDNRVHRVRAGRRATLSMTTCDIAVAYPLRDGWWYIWLNK